MSHKDFGAHREEPPGSDVWFHPSTALGKAQGQWPWLLEQAGHPGPWHLVFFRKRKPRPPSSSRKPLNKNTAENASAFPNKTHSSSLVCDLFIFLTLSTATCNAMECLSQTVLSTLCNKIKPKILVGTARLVWISHWQNQHIAPYTELTSVLRRNFQNPTAHNQVFPKVLHPHLSHCCANLGLPLASHQHFVPF